jgi:hypothetical protein
VDIRVCGESFTMALHNVLVKIANEYMEFQSVLHDATLVCIFLEFFTLHGESQSAFGSQGGLAAEDPAEKASH